MTKLLYLLYPVLILTLLAGCSAPAAQLQVAQSNKARNTQPQAAPADLSKLTADNRAFAFDFYQQLRAQNGNLFFSPHSISVALAMTYAGARAETAAQIRKALRFGLDPAQLHPAFNALQLELARREQNQNDPKQTAFRLSVVNALWGQRDYQFLGDYLDLLALNYGAGMRLLDYRADPEAARKTINDWVAGQTANRIRDLIPASAIDRATTLVLTNAIYFNAPWQYPFQETQTQNAPFTLLDGSRVDVATMNVTQEFGYYAGDGFSALELPYAGGQVSMVILAPDAGKFTTFEQGLNAAQWDAIRKNLNFTRVSLFLPKFSFTSELSLKKALIQMGMSDAFTPGKADLSGMDGGRELFISDALHKAFVKLDEKGTEAAAATAVIVGRASMPADPVTLKVDRPFLFLIQDRPTGEILFLGRTANPAP